MATHLWNPASHHFRHYRIPIPWTTAVLFPSSLDGGDTFSFLAGITSTSQWSRFGMTTFWDRESLSAIMTFGIRRSLAAAGRTSGTFSPEHATDVLRRTFPTNSLGLTCWQWRYAPTAGRSDESLPEHSLHSSRRWGSATIRSLFLRPQAEPIPGFLQNRRKCDFRQIVQTAVTPAAYKPRSRSLPAFQPGEISTQWSFVPVWDPRKNQHKPDSFSGSLKYRAGTRRT